MIIGIENEFVLRDAKMEKTEGNDFVREAMLRYKKPYYEKYSTSFRLWTGGALYVDGDEPEITTPPIEIKKGCIRRVVHSLLQNRNNLITLLGKFNQISEEGHTLEGYSAHYNISEKDSIKIIKILKQGPAFPLLLLIEQRKSQGVMVRDKYSRIELCGDYTVSKEQMRAAIAYMLGTIEGIREGVDFDKIASRQGMLRYGKTLVLKPKGKKHIARKTEIVGSKRQETLQTLLEQYFHAFREQIGRYAEDEVELLEEFISGKRELECDSASLPEGYKPIEKAPAGRFRPPRIAKALGRAAKTREDIHGIELKVTALDWDEAYFSLGNSNQIKIERDILPDFYRTIDTHGPAIKSLMKEVKPETVANVLAKGDIHLRSWREALKLLKAFNSFIDDGQRRGILEQGLLYKATQEELKEAESIVGKHTLLDIVHKLTDCCPYRKVHSHRISNNSYPGGLAVQDGHLLVGNEYYKNIDRLKIQAGFPFPLTFSYPMSGLHRTERNLPLHHIATNDSLVYITSQELFGVLECNDIEFKPLHRDWLPNSITDLAVNKDYIFFKTYEGKIMVHKNSISEDFKPLHSYSYRRLNPNRLSDADSMAVQGSKLYLAYYDTIICLQHAPQRLSFREISRINDMNFRIHSISINNGLIYASDDDQKIHTFRDTGSRLEHVSTTSYDFNAQKLVFHNDYAFTIDYMEETELVKLISPRKCLKRTEEMLKKL